LKLIPVVINDVFITHIVETIAKSQAITEEPQLCWCNGVVFLYEETNVEEHKTKKVNGIWYLEKFVYAKCKEKISNVKWNGFEVEVNNMAGFTNFETLIDLILNREIKQ
jgi:hypothetical protein